MYDLIVYWQALHNMKNTMNFLPFKSLTHISLFYSRIEKANTLLYINPEAFQNLPSLRYL